MVASRNSFRKQSTTVLRRRPSSQEFGPIWTINVEASMAHGHKQRQALSINIMANHLSLFGGSLDITAPRRHTTLASYTEQSPSYEARCCLAKKFPVFYGTRRFFIVFTRVRQWFLSWSLMNPVHTSYFFEINFNITLSSISRST
jgi:hypothetical protein